MKWAVNIINVLFPGAALSARLGHQVARLLLRLVQVVAAHGSVGERERPVDAQLLPEEQEVPRLLGRRQPLQLLQLPLMLEDKIVALEGLTVNKVESPTPLSKRYVLYLELNFNGMDIIS